MATQIQRGIGVILLASSSSLVTVSLLNQYNSGVLLGIVLIILSVNLINSKE